MTLSGSSHSGTPVGHHVISRCSVKRISGPTTQCRVIAYVSASVSVSVSVLLLPWVFVGYFGFSCLPFWVLHFIYFYGFFWGVFWSLITNQKPSFAHCMFLSCVLFLHRYIA